MTCRVCGKPVPIDAERCPSCNALAPERVVVTSRKTPWAIIGVLAAVIVLLVVFLILNRRGPEITAAPSTPAPPAGPPLTQAPPPVVPQAGPPVTAAPAQPAPTLPKEDPDKAAVAAYLNRVSAIEKQRQMIVNDTTQLLVMIQVMKAMTGGLSSSKLDELMATTPEEEAEARAKAQQQSSGQALGQVRSYSQRLRTLDQQFRAIPVPKPANAFAAAYDNALARYVGAIEALGAVVQQAEAVTEPDQATNAIMQLQQARTTLTTSVAQGLQYADGQLDTLTSKYGIPKPFTVSDTPPGDITGLGG